MGGASVSLEYAEFLGISKKKISRATCGHLLRPARGFSEIGNVAIKVKLSHIVSKLGVIESLVYDPIAPPRQPTKQATSTSGLFIGC